MSAPASPDGGPSAHGLPPRPLVLVGLPGAGKTTVGRLLAAQLALPFVDFDEEIERREGRRVAEIFAGQGEAAFRAMERSLTTELVGRAMVVAPGGGWMADPGNPALFRPGGRIIHLVVRPETALGRMHAEWARRPLLAGDDPLAALVSLAERRRRAYDAADAAVDTEGLAPQEVADAIRALL